jgi:hypothetical protein
MRTAARLYLDDVAKDRFTDDTYIDFFLNSAQAECQKVIDQADEGYFSSVQTYTVVPCQTNLEFDLQIDFKKLILAEAIYSTGLDPVPAIIVPFRDRHRLHAMNTGGEPVIYLRGTKLGVVEPSTSYTLRVWYTKRIPTLAADTDVSEIPVEYHNLVCMYACRLGFMSEHREIPDLIEREYEAEMNRLAAHIESRQLQTPRTVHYVEN